MGGATHRPPILVRHDMGQKNMGQKIKPADDPAQPAFDRQMAMPPARFMDQVAPHDALLCFR